MVIKSSKMRSRGRATPSNDIVAGLRARILDGTFTAGQRLPTHVMIEKEFRSTPPTVAKALDVLKRDGFIRSEVGRGMFVTSRPPHQHHYALAMASGHDEHLSQFYVALRNEAARFQSSGNHFSIFYDIGGHTDTEDYQRLLGFVRSHRLAGLIFTESPFLLEGSPLLEEPGVPRVAIASEAAQAGVPAVYPNLDDFLPKALDHLAAHGRKRVAMLSAATEPRYDEFVKKMIHASSERGMICRPNWIHAVHGHAARWASNIAQLLMDSRERPDALVILDDNIVEHTTAGIAASGVRVPTELEIVAHANFPWPTPSAVPVRRLGYDIGELLELCVARVDAQRRGEQPERLTLLPALFEEEVAANKSVPGVTA